MKFLTHIIFSLIISGCTLLITSCEPTTDKKNIGIIVPMEHKAMQDIVSGFIETLRTKTPYALHFKVANAQADINLQRAIIQQMKDENYDLIVPIGTNTTEMAAAMLRKQPIISLAASFTQAQREKKQPCNIAIVHDEISSEQILQFIHKTYPQLTQLTLVHSASDKIFPEVKATINTAKTLGIRVKPMMIQALNELYTTANNISSDTQAILVLKDSLIVSGISILEKMAAIRHIPLITSDQGSVEDGAAMALGVHERDIGIEGAKLAAEVLAGKPICSLAIVDMSKLTVFINKNTLDKEKQSLEKIRLSANGLHYAVETIDKKEHIDG
jgi:putative ABC transport system substrate-binding protein